MARPAAQGLMPSILDRLADPDVAGDNLLQGFTPAQMMASIRRDLEDLFNTHATPAGIPAVYVEVRRSIVTFGMPDLPSISAADAFRRGEVGRIIEEVIAQHEPRLRDVRARLNEPGPDDAPHRVRFQIEARLNVDPSPEVAFETIVELTTGQASIRAGVAS